MLNDVRENYPHLNDKNVLIKRQKIEILISLNAFTSSVPHRSSCDSIWSIDANWMDSEMINTNKNLTMEITKLIKTQTALCLATSSHGFRWEPTAIPLQFFFGWLKVLINTLIGERTDWFAMEVKYNSFINRNHGTSPMKQLLSLIDSTIRQQDAKRVRSGLTTNSIDETDIHSRKLKWYFFTNQWSQAEQFYFT